MSEQETITIHWKAFGEEQTINKYEYDYQVGLKVIEMIRLATELLMDSQIERR